MALALPHHTTLAAVMPSSASSSPRRTPPIDCRIVISSSEPRSHARPDALLYDGSPSPLSPVESEEDMPMSPITFGKNEVYERSRLSYYIAPPPRPSSSPSTPLSAHSPGSLSPISPVIFSQLNSSSPSLTAVPPPVFPSAGTQSLALLLNKRPLPPLPSPDTDDDSDAQSSSRSRARPSPQRAHTYANSAYERVSTSSSDGRDSSTASSPADSSSPATASQSPSTSVYTTASSDSARSSRAVDAFRYPLVGAGEDPKFHTSPLIFPPRSHSTPLPGSLWQAQNPPQKQNILPLIGRPIVDMSPSIAVTPASPQPAQQFFTKQRSASSTSIVLPSPSSRTPSPVPMSDRDRDLPPAPTLPDSPAALQPELDFERAVSPSPSLSPSVASGRSFASAGRSLKRIASKTRLFGRRTLSTASEPWLEHDGSGRESRAGGSSSSDGRPSTSSSFSRTRSRSRSRTPSLDSSSDNEGSTVVGHASFEVDRRTLTLRPNPRPAPRRSESSASSATLASDIGAGGKSSGESTHPAFAPLARTGSRLEIAEVTLTPGGDVWEERELHDVIPKLRQLRAPARLRM